MKTAALFLVAAVTACTSDPPVEPGWVYPQLEAEPQRTGDPVKGYDYLVNGGYITCGVPKVAYDQLQGEAPEELRLPGRTGDNATLPYNFSAATSVEGARVVAPNCLQCHGALLNGQVVVGLGAHDGDFTQNPTGLLPLLDNLLTDAKDKAQLARFIERAQAIAPYTQTLTIGVNPADNLTAVLMSHRDPATLAWSKTPRLELPPPIVAPVDVPPWWRMGKKTSMFYTAAGRGDHARIMMAAALLCTETEEEAAAIDAAFVDVRAYIAQMTPPKWPYAIDAALAEEGKPIYEASCGRCHGSYGEGGVYPNVYVPIDEVKTDGTLAAGASQFSARFVQWFAGSFWGEMSRLEPQTAYVPPPLDGIWATAPFFHNGSVPTLEGVLDTTKRPQYWTRTFDSSDYDQAALGWKFTSTGSRDAEPNAQQKVRIYDTTKLGYGNGGHDYGDLLTPDERKAVLEYLKTL